MGPHRSAGMVAGGAVVYGRPTHWAGIFHICVISISYGLLSFSIIVLVVFCLQFSVFCYLFTKVSLLSAMSSLFDVFIHTYSEGHSVGNNNFFSLTLQR